MEHEKETHLKQTFHHSTHAFR